MTADEAIEFAKFMGAAGVIYYDNEGHSVYVRTDGEAAQFHALLNRLTPPNSEPMALDP